MKFDANAQIIPLGDVDRDVLLFLKGELQEIFNVEFRISKLIPVPQSTYDAKRDQYYSSPLLHYLNKSTDRNIDLILGVIDKDLYVPQLNFVFGEAELNGRFAIISLTRLKPEFYGLPKNQKIFFQRAIKEAVHEIGHVFGLNHCSNPQCVMFFSNSLSDTDRKNKFFCKNCLKNLPLKK